MFWFLNSSSVDCGWTCQLRVADIHMRPDAKNLVTTARTIYLPEQKETICMMSMLRKKPVQVVFMILLTFQLRIVWQIDEVTSEGQTI